MKTCPLFEFDSALPAVIEPRRNSSPDVPRNCVICFFQDVIDDLCLRGLLTPIALKRTEIGEHPVYAMESEFGRLVVFHPGVGAPLAALLFEQVIALGCTKFVACGGAGSLLSNYRPGGIVVPTSAVRDEGTSYHYLPPGKRAAPSSLCVAAIEAVLERRAVGYRLGKTWTTDALFRETPSKVARRRSQRCLTVEMESAALFAVAAFRKVQLGQILYAGDDVSGSTWKHNNWRDMKSVRERLFFLAAEACLTVGKTQEAPSAT